MKNTLLTEYAEFLRNASQKDLLKEIEFPERLVLEREVHRNKRLLVAYAPFDHVNENAKVVIVGLTPGRQQMRGALLEASRLLRSGATIAEAEAGAKVHASFAGPMRANLVAMLDGIGLAARLGLNTTADFWGNAADRVHFTSALRYPVFVNEQNYSGAPDILRTPLLRQQMTRWFGTELGMLRNAVFVPLGPKVSEAMIHAGSEAGIDPRRILSGLPHPSGANAERIAFFLGRKERAALSQKVAPARILAAKATLLENVSQLGA